MEQRAHEPHPAPAARSPYTVLAVLSFLPLTHAVFLAWDPHISLAAADRIRNVLFYATLASPLLWVPLWLHVRRHRRVVWPVVLYGVCMLPLVFLFLLFGVLNR